MPKVGLTLSPLQQHLARWDGCTRCELATQRGRMCHLRGTMPADVLFIGEAPGESEDARGRPFDGPAGQLLDRIINRAGFTETTYALTNLVACFPAVAKREGVNEPPDDAIRACLPRLAELIKLARPRLLVLVGSLSAKWIRRKERELGADIRRVDIVHPAFILRSNVAQQGLLIQQCVVRLANALEEPDVPLPQFEHTEKDIPF